VSLKICLFFGGLFIFQVSGVDGSIPVPLTACQGQAVVFFAKQKISTVRYDP
jgi:hypothetical protein